PSISMAGYDTFGERTVTRDPKGRDTFLYYDTAGRPYLQILPDYTPPDGGPTITAAQSTMDYDSLGRLWHETDPLGHVVTHHYDALSRPDWVSNPDNVNAKTSYEYDLDGRTTAVVDPTGARSEATYDYLGRQLTTTEIERNPAAAYTTSYTYRTSGLLK